MKVLWETGPTTVQGVHAGIQEVRPLAFNTVQTVLSILYRKGKVKRTLRDRAYVYRPAVTRDDRRRPRAARPDRPRVPEPTGGARPQHGPRPPAHAAAARGAAEARGGGGTRWDDAGRLLSTLALNAAWQVPAIVAAAAVADLLLRRAPARTRHALWRVALVLAVGLPAPRRPSRAGRWPVRPAAAGSRPSPLVPPRGTGGSSAAEAHRSGIGRRGSRGARARRLAVRGPAGLAAPPRPPPGVSPAAVRRRGGAIGEGPRPRAGVRGGARDAPASPSSAAPGLDGPITVGSASPGRPPSSRLRLRSRRRRDPRGPRARARARERRDYGLNLAFEAALLPFAWHPAARVLRRRLGETREMACDELASESLLGPRRYARSLVDVASGILRTAPSPGLGVERRRHPRGPDPPPPPPARHAAGRRRLAVAAGVALLLATSLFASFAVVEAKPLPAAPAEWRSQMKHVVGAMVLALGLPANGRRPHEGPRGAEGRRSRRRVGERREGGRREPERSRRPLHARRHPLAGRLQRSQEPRRRPGASTAARDRLKKTSPRGTTPSGRRSRSTPSSSGRTPLREPPLPARRRARDGSGRGEGVPGQGRGAARTGEGAQGRRRHLSGTEDGVGLPPPAPGKRALPPPPPPPPPATKGATTPPPPPAT